MKPVTPIVDHLAVGGRHIVDLLDQLVHHVSGEPERDVQDCLGRLAAVNRALRPNVANRRPRTNVQTSRELLDREVDVLHDEPGLKDAVGRLTKVEEHGWIEPLW